ncbi:VanZ family protein [Stutzerimonas azotifigens]|uniref:VanZ-like domain-containing protein n=1 Tax=Stutzerimonas azotifigens TaxID=291995 RepID=A0ABR5Z4W2_9GAMM|nr:VanZ family protein [Stutzerimonas azotifigens]MBA1275176.1 hypothetical protein [Stutzerimonas azotifigens]
MMERGKLLRCLPFLAALSALLAAALASTPLPEPIDNADKLYHWLGFMVLTLCAQVAHPRAALVTVLASVLAIGASIELIQAFLPTRIGSWKDMLANLAGATSGALILWCYRWFQLRALAAPTSASAR